MTGEAEATTVCVTGAAGFIGSWLVMRLLERGYIVHATVRDPENMEKVKHLYELPKANTNLKMWKADMTEEGSFDKAIDGCAGVFHVATPMDFESKDPENEVIKPTIEGALSIINSCVKAKTVKRLVFTSSAGTVDVKEHQEPSYDETSWSDLEFIHAKKMTGWMYFVSKILAEKSLCKVAKENNIDFISIIPTVVVGPFITPTFPPSLITALSPITGTLEIRQTAEITFYSQNRPFPQPYCFLIAAGNEAHYPIIKQGQYVHLDDLCEAHIFLYEHPKAEGRYICSSHEATIYGLAEMIREKWPEYNVPTEFEGIDKDLPIVCFSSKKLLQMGFQFRYSLEDMFQEAIRTCQEKGLLPYSFKDHINGKEKDILPKFIEKTTEAKDIIPISTETPADAKQNGSHKSD